MSTDDTLNLLQARRLQEMPPHVERMCDEAIELGVRIEKLRAFMQSDRFDALDGEEQELLALQAAGMTTYAHALSKRLNLVGVV